MQFVERTHLNCKKIGDGEIIVQMRGGDFVVSGQTLSADSV